VILAIDTTHEFGSIALLSDGGELLEEMLLHAENGFGQILFGHLSQVLDRHGCSLRDIDCFAAAAGPGSFTGVRVGLACVKGLAEANGKRVVAVSNLQALAAFGTEPLRAIVLDARRGEVYGAVYNAELNPVAQEVVMTFPHWLKTLPPGAIEFISTDFSPFRDALAGTPFETTPIVETPRALAGAIARIAETRFRCGLAADPAQVDANYVRRSDAELFWKDS
jgi:tRNA threonylcarbamoyladenosine biosynthesis protein TsaB